MLYRFKSQATPDLILLPADGETVLRLLGKPSSRSGIITVEQLPAAIATLESVARQDRALTRAAREERNQAPAAHNPPAGEDCEDDIDDDIDDVIDAEGTDADAVVTLAQRLAPFVAMLSHARREGQPVVWGV